MTREEFHAKWAARRAEWEKLGALVSGARMCEELIADFENVLTSHDEAVLDTNQAAAMTGYSRAQLLRQYKEGRLRDTRKGSTCSSGLGICRGSRGEGGRSWRRVILRHGSFEISDAEGPSHKPSMANDPPSSDHSPANRSLTLQLYNAGPGPAKYIAVDWRFDLDHLARRANTLGPDKIAISSVADSFLSLHVFGAHQTTMTHNIRSQRRSELHVLPSQSDDALALPPIYGDLVAAYVAGLSASPSANWVPDAFQLPKLEATLRYIDLENHSHERAFHLTPHLVMVSGVGKSGSRLTNPIARGYVHVREG